MARLACSCALRASREVVGDVADEEGGGPAERDMSRKRPTPPTHPPTRMPARRSRIMLREACMHSARLGGWAAGGTERRCDGGGTNTELWNVSIGYTPCNPSLAINLPNFATPPSTSPCLPAPVSAPSYVRLLAHVVTLLTDSAPSPAPPSRARQPRLRSAASSPTRRGD
jgi:hypothetical protein